MAHGAVLHHQYADHAAAAQHRHAHQRFEDFFAGFWPVCKMRMRLRVGQRNIFSGLRNQTDKAFAYL